MDEYEVVMDGGGPWGIRLQGGKDFGVPLNVARVTPGSKANLKGLVAGDQITSINNNHTEHLTHMEAQNLIKGAGDRLQLCLKKGTGTSLGEVKQVGSGGFAAQPKQTLYQTDVTHSAAVDHRYNAKPKSFITSTNASAGGTTHVSVPVKKFDPGEYARKKKEELEKYKEDTTKPLVDSDVLKMLQKTSVTDKKESPAGSFAGLQKQLDNEGNVSSGGEQSFRMTADGTDLSDVSPGSRAVMEDIKHRGTSNLSSAGGGPSGGSRSFRMLQHITSQDEDLPPPPPELMIGNDDDFGSPKQVQSHTFKMLQDCVSSGNTDQIRTGLDKPRNPSYGSVPAAPTTRNLSNSSYHETTVVNPIPKAPFPTGPNFKVGRAAAPTFKSGSGSSIGAKAPPPPAVNAGEIVNTNSRIYQAGAYPSGSGSQDDRGSVGSQGSYNRSPRSTGSQGSLSNDDMNRTRLTSSNASPPAPVSPYNRDAPRPSPPSAAPARGPPSQSGDKLCQACQQPLVGPFVSAIGKMWHPDHFCCSACNTSLQNQAFVEENSQLFCEKCYNQYYAPKCAHCNNAIIGDYGKDTIDAICDICSAVASSRGIYDPIVCSKSINWLKQQIREANEIFETATRKKEEEHTHWIEAKQKIMSLNKKRALIEEQIEHQERDFGNIQKLVQYKMKVCAANANLCIKAEHFDQKIDLVEKNLYSSRERLNGWQQKLASVVDEYKAKRSRLEEIQRRKMESHNSLSTLETDLAKMKHRIKVLNGKKSFRKVKLEATEDEMDSIEEEIRDAEQRQILSEQHVMSLGTYLEALENEFLQQRMHTQNVIDQLQALKLLKKEKLRGRNVSHSVRLVK